MSRNSHSRDISDLVSVFLGSHSRVGPDRPLQELPGACVSVDCIVPMYRELSCLDHVEPSAY